MYSRNYKNKAISLREQGYSLGYIAEKLDVAKSTLSVWLKSVTFFPNEITRNSVAHGQKQAVATKRSDKAISLARAYKYAQESVGVLSKRDRFLVGIGIYIGEGGRAFNSTRIANSDPRTIGFCLSWLKECFGLMNKNIRIRVHIYPDNNEKRVLTYWMKELGLGKKSFYPCFIDRRVGKRSKKVNVLPYGTAHMSVVSNGNKDFGVLLHRKILATIDRILTMRG
jgi:transposase-like protein